MRKKPTRIYSPEIQELKNRLFSAVDKSDKNKSGELSKEWLMRAAFKAVTRVEMRMRNKVRFFNRDDLFQTACALTYEVEYDLSSPRRRSYAYVLQGTTWLLARWVEYAWRDLQQCSSSDPTLINGNSFYYQDTLKPNRILEPIANEDGVAERLRERLGVTQEEIEKAWWEARKVVGEREFEMIMRGCSLREMQDELSLSHTSIDTRKKKLYLTFLSSLLLPVIPEEEIMKRALWLLKNGEAGIKSEPKRLFLTDFFEGVIRDSLPYCQLFNAIPERRKLWLILHLITTFSSFLQTSPDNFNKEVSDGSAKRLETNESQES